MATLANIEKQIAKLMKEKEALLRIEAEAAVRQARELIEKFGLTAVDVGLGKKTRAAKAGVVATAKRAAKAVAAPKYRDPATGKTWTGRGKPPNWIAGAKDRGQFLIADEGIAATSTATSKAAKVPAKKSTQKAAAAPKGGPRKEAVAAPATGAALGKASAKRSGGRAAAKRSAKSAKTAAAVSTSGAADTQAVQ